MGSNISDMSPQELIDLYDAVDRDPEAERYDKIQRMKKPRQYSSSSYVRAYDYPLSYDVEDLSDYQA